MKGLQKRIHKIFTKNREEKSLKLSVQLDGEARIRLERLKAKMPKSDENQMVSLALKCLEQKWDLIVRRQAIKRVRTLKNEGMNLEQIAIRLNDERFPTPTAFHHWSGDLISEIQKNGKDEQVSKNHS